jgi:pimeloyl-ACP methyl ester carboxylesterase
MRTFLVVFLFITSFCKAQNILNHEKEIPNKDNYNSEEINFKVPDKKNSIEFSGTLMSPKTDWKTVVIIVPGSGADTQNSHYLLTEELLKSNIAVYRYDERGMGKSGGKFNGVNYTITKMAEELAICIQTLRQNKSLSGKRLGLLGHSQGGMVTIQTYENHLPIDFMVQWATPVQKHGEFIKYQITNGQNTFKDDIIFDDINKKIEVVTALHKVVAENLNDDDLALSKKLNKTSKQIGYTKEHYTRFPYLTFVNEKDIVRKNFESIYKSIKIPVLYIIGSKDTYVNPESETQLLSSFENKNITISKMDGLTHYLTTSQLTLKNRYDIDKRALTEIVNWIKIR